MENEEADIILKPLRGSGGDRVFLVRRDDAANLNQILDAVARTGYVIAQQYLDAAAEGDIRLFLMNGRPLEVDGCYAAFRRLHTGGDVRATSIIDATQAKCDMVASYDGTFRNAQIAVL